MEGFVLDLDCICCCSCCRSGDEFVNAGADGVPGIGYVGDAVPGHGAELNHYKHQRQHVLLPPEGGAEREEEGQDHDDGRNSAGFGKHIL